MALAIRALSGTVSNTEKDLAKVPEKPDINKRTLAELNHENFVVTQVITVSMVGTLVGSPHNLKSTPRAYWPLGVDLISTPVAGVIPYTIRGDRTKWNGDMIFLRYPAAGEYKFEVT